MNSEEIFKLTRLTGVWLCLIFFPVWGACWAVGVLIPNILTELAKDSSSQNILMFVSDLCKALTPILSVLVFIPINAMFMVLFERRALALFTVRMGPNRTGFDGLAQTAADAVKLLFKEDITPTGADAVLFTLAPIIFFAPSIFGALPLLAAITGNHELFQIVNIPTGVFYILAAASLPVVALVMAGWSSNNKYSLVGGLRAAAQAVSYEIPLVLALITMCLMAGTLDVVKIAEQQAGGILNWNILGGGALAGLDKALPALLSGNTVEWSATLAKYYPHGFISAFASVVLVICTVILCGLYLTSACAEINRIPFDLPEAESELVSGYNTEYSGIKFAIFFLAEFTNLFIVSSIATVMFFGGGSNPIPQWILAMLPMEQISGMMNALLDIPINKLQFLDPKTFWNAFWVIVKVYSIVFFAVLVRGTLPRFRIDQLMDFGWKRLVPLALVTFLVVVFARVAVVCHAG
ncbi:MAG: complex I subunit 1 family protein [Candidatus Melainabacteria bacterium]|nr:complex I subunit 1 family protein [Candidatus Melainabacteria bacterium]